MAARGGIRRARNEDLGFLAAAAVVAVVNLVPHGEIAVYPLALLTTWFHELGHALAALVLGADVRGLVVRADTSGLATYAYDPAAFGTFSRAVVASAGYLGAALVAAGLLAASRRPAAHRPVLGGLAALLVLTVLLWVRTFFGVVALVALAAGLAALSLRASPRAACWALRLLGLQIALNALFDIRALYYVRGGSDAEAMSRIVGLPAAFWASVWLLASGVVLGLTFRRVLRE